METMENPTSSMNIAQIEQSREQIHKRIDAQYDGIVQKMLMNGTDISLPEGHKIMSMATNPARFKGTKPAYIRFPDGRMTAVKKWRLAVLEILWDCNHNPRMHQALMDLRGKVNGRLRPILTQNLTEMDVPLMIDENLYPEGKLDTEFILKIVKRDILDCVGYDYSGIGIVVQEPELEQSQERNQTQNIQMY